MNGSKIANAILLGTRLRRLFEKTFPLRLGRTQRCLAAPFLKLNSLLHAERDEFKL